MEGVLHDLDVIKCSREWVLLFTFCTYVMAAGCLYRGIKQGAAKGAWEALGQVAIFGSFVFIFWSVESWAHFRASYYIYSDVFTDLIPRIPDTFFTGILGDCVRPDPTTCSSLVTKTLKTHNDLNYIPLSVILMEASLTYSAMWTARRLGANIWVQPFLAGLMLLIVDILLDPVVAKTHICTGQFDVTRDGVGVGLWHWFVQGGQPESWIGIPLYNYASWLGFPIIAVVLANFGGPFLLNILIRPVFLRRPPAEGYSLKLGLGLLIAPATYGVLMLVGPNNDLPSWARWTCGFVAALLVLGVVFSRFGRYRTDEELEIDLTRPVAIALLLPSLILLVEGYFVAVPVLIPIAILAVTAGLWLSLLPCRSALIRIAERVGDLDRFTRTRYFGFTVMMIIPGPALMMEPKPLLVLGLLVVAACFHLYAYVPNGLIDYRADQTRRLHAGDPPTKMGITPEQAAAWAWVAVLVAFLALLHLVEFKPFDKPWPLLFFGVAVLLMWLYDLCGKRFPYPFIRDLIQGLAWGSLSLVGGFLIESTQRPEVFWFFPIAMGLYGMFFILLLNGIHGGLRDLVADKAAGHVTTAIFFGARPVNGSVPEKGVEGTWTVATFAFVVHTLQLALAASFIWQRYDAFAPHWGVAAAALALLSAFSYWCLWQVVKPRTDRRNRFLTVHVFVALFPPLLLYTLADRPSTVFQVVLWCCFFTPLVLQEEIMKKVINRVYRSSAGASCVHQNRLLK